MRVQVFHLFFNAGDNGALVPADPALHALAEQFVQEHMATPVNFLACKENWVACEVDQSGNPIRALGLLCMVMRPDFVVCRFTESAAVVKLVQRANDFLHDNYNARGAEALVYISKQESSQPMCPDYENWMKAFDMKDAERWTIKVR